MGDDTGAEELAEALLREMEKGSAARRRPTDPAAPRPEVPPSLRDLLDVRDAKDLEALREAVKTLLPPEESQAWLSRLDELQAARELVPPATEPGTLPTPAPVYVLILDRRGEILASRGDARDSGYESLTKALQLTVPGLAPGAHVMSHKVGRVGVAVGTRGVVAGSLPSKASLEVLVRVLARLERKDGQALESASRENRRLVDGYAEACLRLLRET